MPGYTWLGGQGWGSGAGLGCATSTHAGTGTDEAEFNFMLFHTLKGRGLSHLPKAPPSPALTESTWVCLKRKDRAPLSLSLAYVFPPPFRYRILSFYPNQWSHFRGLAVTGKPQKDGEAAQAQTPVPGDLLIPCRLQRTVHVQAPSSSGGSQERAGLKKECARHQGAGAKRNRELLFNGFRASV